MTHLVFDFAHDAKLEGLKSRKTEFVTKLCNDLDIPYGYTAGSKNPYVTMEGDVVKIRHLTYVDDAFFERINGVCEKVFGKCPEPKKETFGDGLSKKSKADLIQIMNNIYRGG